MIDTILTMLIPKRIGRDINAIFIFLNLHLIGNAINIEKNKTISVKHVQSILICAFKSFECIVKPSTIVSTPKTLRI